MSIFTLVIKNILQRKFSVLLTVISVSLGVALIGSTLAIKEEVEKNFNQSNVGYEMIVGAKGSSMQLVLNTVFMLGNPVGNIRYEVYEKLKHDRRIALALPYALGDNYDGFNIVGTTDDLFTKFNYKVGKSFSFASGHAFEAHSKFQAVLGFDAAKSTGLKIGDEFIATHGLQETAEGMGHQHEETPFTVVGILNRTGTASDKIIYTTVESVWAVHEHELHHEHEPEALIADHDAHMHTNEHERANETQKNEHVHEHDHHHHEGISTEDHHITDLTAVLIKVRSPLFALHLYKQINDWPLAQAAIPVNEIKSLFEIISNIDWAFFLITVLVIVVALIGMMVSIYNSLYERRREISIMRALGAHRSKIFGIIILEAFTISFFGALFGLFFSKLLSLVLKGYILETTGVEISVKLLTMISFYEITELPVELLIMSSVSFIGALVAIIPAIVAYKTDVSKNLSPIS